MLRHLANIYRLGVKELWSLWRDPMMLALIGYIFTVGIYTAATAMPENLHKAPIAIVDEDGSALSQRLIDAFYPPHFSLPERVSPAQADAGLDAGRYTFVLDIPPHFQRDVLAGRSPALQLNIDATRMSQAFSGNVAVQQMLTDEVNTFVQRHAGTAALPVGLELRARFNPGLEPRWFGALMQLINDVTMLSMILTGAALIREREHGTVEHLLVMPVTPTEIMLAKVWSMALVVLVATAAALYLVIQQALGVPVQGSVALFLAGAALHLFAATSLGIFMATVARSMPQFGLLLIITLIPLIMLSGGMTPRESMPQRVQDLMQIAPTTHFTELGQAILYRGAGLDLVWPSFVALAAIGTVLFALSLLRFRKTIGQMA